MFDADHGSSFRIKVINISFRRGLKLPVFFFSHQIFVCSELDEPFRDKEIFDNTSFYKNSDLGFESIIFGSYLWRGRCQDIFVG